VRGWSSVRLAVRSLRAHPLRTALTTLGIVIGVATVITMVALGAGARERVAEQIESMGANLVLVWARPAVVGGARLGAGTQPTVTEADASAIQRDIPLVAAAAPFTSARVGLIHRNQNWITVLQAITPEFLVVGEWDIAAGREIAPGELETGAKVILLGGTVADRLFGETDPIGQGMRVNNVPFRVIGVLERKGQSAWGQDQDDVVLVPLSTGRRNIIGRNPATARAVGSISVKVTDARMLPAAMTEVRAVLRERHRLQPDQEDDFVMHDLAEMTRAQATSSNVLSMLLAAIASVSLLSGGVGIMNIMLVSVRERTREIRLRIAVGATRRDILEQFLVEAVALSLVGGLLGATLGIAAAYVVASVANWHMVIQAEVVLASVAVSTGIGLAFGLYPAHRAARLDPIVALRYE